MEHRMQGGFETGLTGERRMALEGFEDAAAVCGWCADRCLDEGPGMETCIRLCRDVEGLASLNARFVARNSVFGPQLAETFVRAARQCAAECARHPHDHCQECARVLNRVIDATMPMPNAGQGQFGGFQQPMLGSY